MADVGLDFKSPKKTAEKEWKIIEGLFTIGKSLKGYRYKAERIVFWNEKAGMIRVEIEKNHR